MKLLRTSPDGDPSSSKRSLADDVESYRVLTTAQAKLKRAGLHVPRQPKDEDGEPLRPKLDIHMSSVDNATLGRMYAEFAAHADYVGYAAAVAEVNLATETAIFEYVKAKVRLTKSGKVHEQRDKTSVDPRVIEAQQTFLEKQAVAKLTAVLLDNAQRDVQVVSREISRRQLELDQRNL